MNNETKFKSGWIKKQLQESEDFEREERGTKKAFKLKRKQKAEMKIKQLEGGYEL